MQRFEHAVFWKRNTMAPHLVPQKTAAARQFLQSSRQSLAPGLRMLLITIDGRKRFADLQPFVQGLGLTAAAFEQLRDQGLIAWSDGTAGVASESSERAKGLVRAKFFAMDLAARMLAGRDAELRDQARCVDSESSFHVWIDQCAVAIAAAGNAERATLFRERVATVL